MTNVNVQIVKIHYNSAVKKTLLNKNNIGSKIIFML